MDRLLVRVPLLAVLGLLAAAGLAWGGWHALAKSDDLMRRAEEVALFVDRANPYADPDMSYPPSALPIFAAGIAPIPPEALRPVWLVWNLAALAVLCGTIVRLWGRSWPGWLVAAFCLTVAASKPVRGGIGLGQFHLIPDRAADRLGGESEGTPANHRRDTARSRPDQADDVVAHARLPARAATMDGPGHGGRRASGLDPGCLGLAGAEDRFSCSEPGSTMPARKRRPGRSTCRP